MKWNTQKIDCFIPYTSKEQSAVTIQSLKDSGMVNQIFLLSSEPVENAEYPVLVSPSLYHTDTLMRILQSVTTEYFLIYFKEDPLKLEQSVIQRMHTIAKCNCYAWVYSDYYAIENGQEVAAPLIDCQRGSVRDDFDMGAFSLIHSHLVKDYFDFKPVKRTVLKYAAWYELRLLLMEGSKNYIYHLQEKSYTVLESDLRKSGEKQFDYVNPAMREVQIEMEQAFTLWLEEQGLRLCPDMIRAADVDLIINTPKDKAGRADHFRIMSAAIDYSIPYVSTVFGAEAAVKAIEAMKEKTITIEPLSHYIR